MNKRALCALVGAAVCAFAHQASAEIPLTSAKGWELSLDGRVNTFLSFATGDALPTGIEIWQGFYDYGDANGHLTTSRIRTGFIQNVLGFTLKKQLSSDTTLTARFAPWVGVSQQRSKIDYPTVDVREVYFKVDGPWGGALAGRNLSLYSRGPILLDYDIEHAYGLGSPCSLQSVQGGACGHAGFGILFPGFNAGIVYNTPELAGFQLSVGMFDPSAISERSGVNLGPVQLGLAGFYAQGGGIYAPLENYPLFADNLGVLRKQQGFLGLGSITFGNTKIAGGAGLTQILKTINDPSGPFTTGNYPKQQMGISAGIYQHINESLILALEYFRATYSWYDQPDPTDMTMMRIISPVQTVNLINVGGTVVF